MIPRAALLVLLLFTPQGPASAQLAHAFQGPARRAIHVQLMESDALAIGSVEDVGPGRIRLGDLNALEGELAPSIELKRAPSHPPGLAPGERVVLLLRGARSPYLLVPTAEEVLRVADAPGEARMVAALLALRSALSDPAALRERYLAWLSGSDEVLRSLAETALSHPSPPLEDLDPATIRGVVALALDPARPLSLRLAAARVAGFDADGVGELLAALPFEGANETPPLLLLEVLRLGALRASPETNGTLLRSLRHEDPAVRQTVLELGPLLIRTPSLRADLERLAREDPSESVRRAAAPLVRAGSSRSGR